MKNDYFYDAINYSKQASFPSWAKDPIQVQDPMLETAYQSYIDDKDNRWIVFRPTITTKNWIFNFIFPLMGTPYGNKESPVKMHLGFLAGYLGYLRGSLHTLVSTAKRPNSFIITGHSLGGILARISAIDLNYNFGIAPIVRDFAGSNIGNKEFEASYTRRVPNSKSYAVENDLVPKVPLWYGKPERILLASKGMFWTAHEFETYIERTRDLTIY